MDGGILGRRVEVAKDLRRGRIGHAVAIDRRLVEHLDHEGVQADATVVRAWVHRRDQSCRRRVQSSEVEIDDPARLAVRRLAVLLGHVGASASVSRSPDDPAVMLDRDDRDGQVLPRVPARNGHDPLDRVAVERELDETLQLGTIGIGDRERPIPSAVQGGTR